MDHVKNLYSLMLVLQAIINSCEAVRFWWNLQLDLNDTSLMDLLRDAAMYTKVYILNECFLNWYKSEMNAWLELVVKVNSMGRYFKKWLIFNSFSGFNSQWSVDGTTAVETDESKMEFAPLSLEKQIKSVNHDWLNWPIELFQVVDPHLHNNVSPTTNINCSLILFYHPQHCCKPNNLQWEEFRKMFQMF